MNFTKGQVIGISGKRGVGKTTLAGALSAQVPSSLELPLSAALVKEVITALGITESQLYINKEMYRPLLVYWGTVYRRGQDINYWTKQLDAQLSQFTSFNGLILVPDIRFPEDAAWVKNNNGILIRLERDIVPVVADSTLIPTPLATTYDVASDYVDSLLDTYTGFDLVYKNLTIDQVYTTAADLYDRYYRGI